MTRNGRIRTVLVTGASGFVGSHVVKALLDEGYNVVGTARPGPKAEHMKKACLTYGSERFRVVEVNDIFKDTLPADTWKGVDALIHVATPLTGPGLGKTPIEEVVNSSIDGTLNIVKQAYQAGVRTIIVTGSISAVVPNDEEEVREYYGNEVWNPITKEEALSKNDFVSIYVASKKLAEQAIWEWADSVVKDDNINHVDVDVTILHPPLIFGPYQPAAEFFLVTPETHSTNRHLYELINPSGNYPFLALWIDVRDVAKAHRIIIGAPYDFDFKEAVKILEEKRPELKTQGRIISKEVPVVKVKHLGCDMKRVEEVLGMKEKEFITVEKMLLDTIDDYLAYERKWIKQGSI
ncbi:hypothetical protein D9758_017813 [Tetrapyrgos nigripes]|uniref:NAD-dependent epimerase/dehydratase domain-containing protein n=1 Tax=Tetrapyrgos nigripes TaxID=182062 RepID=A0A8H5BH21_9AGAR|nr:hypothetical protein D9758_017813 [Tetrapyrgos nigripes]